MHFSPWLFTVAFFSTSTHAFYPWKKNVGVSTDTKTNERRFFPWQPDEQSSSSAGTSFKLDIKKRPSSMVKRDNEWKVVLADNPTEKSSMAINEDGSDYSYFATVDFGSKGTPMWMLIDTGAANTWVMGESCTSSACQQHDTFGASDSSSLVTSTSSWQVTYGSGLVTGVTANDTVSFAGFKFELEFGLASNTSEDFLSYPFEGILGLGRPDSDSIGTQTVMETLDSKNLLTNSIVGIHLQRNEDGAKNGEITFGATDSSKYTGDITYTSTTDTNGLWQIDVDGCGYNGDSTGLTGRTAIIDTGTTYIFMPPSDAAALHAQIPSSSNSSSSSFTVPCDTTAPVQFTISGVTYNVSHKDYVGSQSGEQCTSNIIGHEYFGDTTWLLGDVFLKNVYSVFDFGKDQIGFAVTASSATSAAPTATVATVKTETAIATSSAKATGTGSSTSASGTGSSSSASASGSGSKSSSAAGSTSTGDNKSSSKSSATRITSGNSFLPSTSSIVLWVGSISVAMGLGCLELLI